MMEVPPILLAAGAALVALVVGGFVGRSVAVRRTAATLGTVEQQSEAIVEAARRESDAVRREAELVGKEEAYLLKEQIQTEADAQRVEIDRLEKRVAEREEMLERKLMLLEERHESLSSTEAGLREAEAAVESRADELQAGISCAEPGDLLQADLVLARHDLELFSPRFHRRFRFTEAGLGRGGSQGQGRAERAGHPGGSAARGRARGEEDHFDGRPAAFCGPFVGYHRVRRASSQRRHEGADHRS